MDAPTAKTLPLFPTLLASWASVPRNLGTAFRLYGPWFAITLVCMLAWLVGVIANSGTGTPSPALLTGAGAVPGLVYLLAFLIGAPAVFVAWHSAIDKGMRVRSGAQIDGTVWSYLGYSILIAFGFALSLGLVVLIVVVIAGLTTGLGDSPMSLERLAALRHFLPLTVLPFYFLFSRFSLVLPAIAVGRPMSLAQSFNTTRGNTWRLTVGAGLVYLPLVIVSGLSDIATIALPDQQTILGLISLLVLIVTLFCLHAALSFGTLALKTLAPEEPMAD